MKVLILEPSRIYVFELVKALSLFKTLQNLSSKRLLEKSFKHGQIHFCMRQLLEDVVISNLRALKLLTLLDVSRLLGSFLDAVNTLPLYGGQHRLELLLINLIRILLQIVRDWGWDILEASGYRHLKIAFTVIHRLRLLCLCHILLWLIPRSPLIR